MEGGGAEYQHNVHHNEREWASLSIRELKSAMLVCWAK